MAFLEIVTPTHCLLSPITFTVFLFTLPIVRAAKTAKDFAENVQKMMSLPKDLTEARAEFMRQMDDLNTKLISLKGKIEQIEREHEGDAARNLFQTYRAVRQLFQSPD